MWVVNVEYLPFVAVMAQLEVVNHHYKVLQLEPLEVWNHGGLVIVMGYIVLLPVLVLPMPRLFISLVTLLVPFISIVETLVIFDSG